MNVANDMQQQVTSKNTRLTDTDIHRNEVVKLQARIKELQSRIINSRGLMNGAVFSIPCRVDGFGTINLTYDAKPNLTFENKIYYITVEPARVFSDMKKQSKKMSENISLEKLQYIDPDILFMHALEHDLDGSNKFANNLANFRAKIHGYVINHLEKNVTALYRHNTALDMLKEKLQVYGEEILSMKFGKELIDV